MERSCILVADDDADIRKAVRLYLEKEGFQVACAADGFEALDLLEQKPVQLILMDVMMPRMDGFPPSCASAKAQPAHPGHERQNRGFRQGSGPFHRRRRLYYKALQRGRTGGPGKKPSAPLSGMGGAGAGALRPHRPAGIRLRGPCPHSRRRPGAPHPPTETRIMELFMRNPGRIFSAEEIYARAWDEPAAYAPENTVMVHIRRIREKIELNPKEPEYLKVVVGSWIQTGKKVSWRCAFCAAGWRRSF